MMKNKDIEDIIKYLEITKKSAQRGNLKKDVKIIDELINKLELKKVGGF